MSHKILKNGNADPTVNVREMIGSAVFRMDDLRRAEALRQDDLRKATEKYMEAELNHVRITEELRAEHALELSSKESERLNSIRQVDVQNTSTQATSAAAAIQTLAVNNAADAEKLRNSLTTTAAAMAKQTADVATAMAAQCVSEDTPILCADLVWRPAGELRVGDELVAFDEEPEEPIVQNEKLCSRGRRFRKSVVIANALCRDELLIIKTPFGSIRCNRRHPWLVNLRGEHPAYNSWRGKGTSAGWTWVEAQDLRSGDKVMRPVDVWEVDRSWSGGWLSGIFDGEGCLCFKSSASEAGRLSVTQARGETADRIKSRLEELNIPFSIRERKPLPNRKPKVDFTVSRISDVMKLLGSIRPQRLLPNSFKVWDGFYFGNDRKTTILSIEDGGIGVVASLSTSTKTYIASGFAMHNTALTVAGITERLGALEKANSEGVGKQRVADPMMAEALLEMKKVSLHQASGKGGQAMWGNIIVGALALIAILTFIIPHLKF